MHAVMLDYRYPYRGWSLHGSCFEPFGIDVQWRAWVGRFPPPTLGNPNVAGFLGVRSTRNGAGGKFSKLPMFKLPGCAGTLEDHVSLAASLQVEQQSSEVLDAVCLCHECSGQGYGSDEHCKALCGTLLSLVECCKLCTLS